MCAVNETPAPENAAQIATPSTKARKNNPYVNAPRLPEGELVDPRDLVAIGEAGVEIEIGPGRGGFAFERLLVQPNIALIGFEVRRKWATIVDNRLRERGLGQRARIFAEDARAALPRLPSAFAAAVFVHFPDPWWKKRHTKRLVVTDSLVPQVARVLRPNGSFFVQTDVFDRAEEYRAVISADGRFVPMGESELVAENPFGARSPREHRAIKDGLPIFRLHYRRID
jgi:tRNA (guanine-N7-)-methyltransferase